MRMTTAAALITGWRSPFRNRLLLCLGSSASQELSEAAAEVVEDGQVSQ
jgi:hypothetical protein